MLAEPAPLRQRPPALVARRPRRTERRDRPEPPRRDDRACGLDEAMAPQVEPNRRDDARGALGLGHPLRRLDVEGERLLDEDVLAGGDRGKGEIGMSQGRSADRRRVQHLGRRGAVGFGVLAADLEPTREPLPRLDIDVGDGDAFHIRVSRHRREMELLRRTSTADHPDPERVVGHRSERHNSW